MQYEQMVDRAAGELTLGLDGAAKLIYDWTSTHPDVALATTCKQVAERAGIMEAWLALEGRVRRMRAKASDGAKSGVSTSVMTERGGAAKRDAKRVLRDAEPEQIAELIAELPEERLAEIAQATKSMALPFKAMTWEMHVDQIVEEVHDAIADGTLTPEAVSRVEVAIEKLQAALLFAAEMGVVAA
jgi:hypothetical protein